MARPPDPDIRMRLRDEAVAYVLSHGISDLSLRPLAKALGTTPRMLEYHFGSREGLMREILTGLREYGDKRIRAWFRRGKKQRKLPEFLHWFWKRVSDPRVRPAVRLTFELYALALRDPDDYPGVLTSPLLYWQTLARKAGVERTLQTAEATLLLAVTRGLLLDLCATGERARVQRALRLLARLLEGIEAWNR